MEDKICQSCGIAVDTYLSSGCKVEILLICMTGFCLKGVNNHINIGLDIKNFSFSKSIS